MKKIYALIILIILIVVLFLVSCGRNTDINKELLDSKDRIIKSLGKSRDNQIVVKVLETNDSDTYYVFKLTNTSFEQYCYRFYKTKDEYDEWVKTYSSGIYRLEKDESALMTKIFAQSGQKSGDKDLNDAIIEKYSDKDKYEIIK